MYRIYVWYDECLGFQASQNPTPRKNMLRIECESEPDLIDHDNEETIKVEVGE